MAGARRAAAESGEGTLPGDSPTNPVKYSEIERELLVQQGSSEFKVTVPPGCRITFGPWSPSSISENKYGASEKALAGTLRIYQGGSKATENIIAVFSGVTSFRDTTLAYALKVAVQEGNAMWKSDQDGYVQEVKQSGRTEWVPMSGPPALPSSEEPF